MNWIIDSTSKLYVNKHAVKLYEELKCSEIFSKLNWGDDYALYITNLYCYYFFDRKNKDANKMNLERFISDLTTFKMLFKAFDLFIFFDQKDKRNIVVFDHLLEKERFSKILASKFYNKEEVLRTLLKKAKDKDTVKIIIYYLNKLKY